MKSSIRRTHASRASAGLAEALGERRGVTRRRIACAVDHRQEGGDRLLREPARVAQLADDAVSADLVELVDGRKHGAPLRLAELGLRHEAVEDAAVVDPQTHPLEVEGVEGLGDGLEDAGLRDDRGRAEEVDVALIEFAEAPALRPVRAPHGLDLVALEPPGQVVPVPRHDAGERHREVVAEPEVRQLRDAGVGGQRGQALTPLQDAEDELVALVAILPEQHVEPLHRRRLERDEAVPLVRALDLIDDHPARSHRAGEEVAHAARGLRRDHRGHSKRGGTMLLGFARPARPFNGFVSYTSG